MASPPESLAELMDEQQALIKCCLCAAQLCNPVQLDCLHDCCKACAEQQLATSAAATARDAAAVPAVGTGAAAAAVDSEAAEPPSPGTVTCPICNETTDGARLSLDLFFDGHVRFLSILTHRPRCDVCSAPLDADKAATPTEPAEAETLCFDCSKLLCSDCLREHRRLYGTHVLRALDQLTCSTELAERCVPPCPRHGQSIDHACLSCELPLCGQCANECMKRRHDVQVLHCAHVKNSVDAVKRDVESFDPLLVRVTDLSQRQKELTGDLADVRRAGLELLRKNKDAVLDAVERAHDKAEEALRSGCEELEKEADEQAAAAARLYTRAAHSSLVGQCVVNSHLAVAVLSKRKPIAQRLRQLTAELHRIDPEEEKERSVSYMEMHGGKLPDEVDLDGIMEFLVGLPKLVRGTNLVKYAHERNIHAERTEREAGLRHHKQNVNQEELQYQAANDGAQSSIEQPAFSAPNSPSISNSVSYNSASLTSTSETVEDVPSLTQPTSPRVSEPLIGQSRGDTNRRQWVKRQRKEFLLKCADCDSLVTDSANLRLLSAQAAEDENWIILHHLVVDMQFPSRVRLHRHWKSAFIGKTADSGLAMRKEYKLSCKKCSNDWGVCVKIQKKYFFIIKIDTLEVVADGVAIKVERWKDLPYTIRSISDRQLLSFGHETIPGDFPLPNRWYTAALPQKLEEM